MTTILLCVIAFYQTIKIRIIRAVGLICYICSINGWEYDDANAPYGEWRGMRVRAVSTRAGSHFVQKVADLMEKAVPGCTVQINPAYGVRERGGEQE